MKKLALLVATFMSMGLLASDICQGYGPQTPRDITNLFGTNNVVFDTAPTHTNMNLCNIHFHKNAEHKGPDFSVYAGPGEFGGFKCNKTDSLPASVLKPTTVKGCKNLKVGDTIEVHWVFTSCNVNPGAGLGSCLSDACANPQLRVEAEVFVLVNDGDALKFQKYDHVGKVGGYHQPGELTDPNAAVEFLGSTTGPSFNQQVCSPLQVTWNVRETCRTMDINSVHQWCQNNKFEEDKAHGVRELVTHPDLLSEIY